MAYYQRHNWEKELPKIKELGLLGWKMPEIGKEFGVSRQRIKQILSKHIPDWNEHYGSIIHRKKREKIYLDKWGVKQDSDLYKIQRAKFRAKKYNATHLGYDWTISFGELSWPTVCPILGIEINYFSEFRTEESPSFDRINSSVGYVPGNVHIISWRANRIKNDGTANEHRKIADYLDNL